jgi:hypothetical protein
VQVVAQADPFPLTVGEPTSSRSTLTNGGANLVSGTMALQYFTATKTETITQVKSYTSGAAAGATPTLCRYGVYSEAANGDLTLVASTPNDTTLWSAAYGIYPKALTAPWSKIAGQRYAVGILIVSAAACPTFCASNVTSANLAGTIMGQTPRIYGASPASQTDLPASLTSAQVAASIRTAYVEMLP